MERRLAAILAADVVGFTRMMERDESGTLQRLIELRQATLQPIIAKHSGRIVKLLGDGLLVEFASVVNAVNCALDWQDQTVRHETDIDEANRLSFRIGINLGDVIVDGDDVYGDGVNVAARLERLAEAGGILISADAFRHARGRTQAVFQDAGARRLKNVSEPVQVYRVTGSRDAAPRTAMTGQLALPDKPSVAVLPFTNMSGDPGQEHFCDGVSEDIITALSKLSKLFVVARNSTFTYKGRAVDVKQVGREQGVRYVLEGSVRRAGARLRITAQLIDATTGHHVWGERYDRVSEDVFEVQDEITREVVSALQIELTEGEQARLWSSGTKNLQAWELVIQIPELLHSHRRADALPARRLAERALQLDDGYATAWAMLGWSYWNDAFNGWSDDPETALERAVEALERARSIDGSNPDTLALLAFLHLSLRKYDEAFAFSEQAMTLGPSNSFAAGIAANVALYCDRPRDVVPLLEKAMRLCPIYPAWYVGDVAYAHLFTGDLEEAISTAHEAIKIDPDYIYSYYVLAIAHSELGQLAEARAAAANILRIEPKFTIGTFARSQPFQNEDVLNRQVDGLRAAGVPE